MKRSPTRPRVTVGIPFYNEERYLADAVRSVLAQTERDIELLLVDDGSTDRSLQIAKTFTDPRVVLLSDGQRRRLPARLNEIARRARSDFVARMDADDVSHPQRIERQLEQLAQDETCDAVGTWAALIDDAGELFAITEASELPVSRETAVLRGLLPHATMLARRSWLLAHPYDESLTRAEDRDLWCRTAGASRFRVVASPLYVVRISIDDPRFLPDYLDGQRQNRTIVLRYGPSTFGYLRTLRTWMASHGKGIAMRAASRAGLAARIVARRGRTPSAHERRLVMEALECARGNGDR